MIERVIENWLDKASERSLQILYSHILSSENYTIVHISRHCGMEMGKDIIAIDPRGTPCAYQIKRPNNKKIRLREWRNINSQVLDLIFGKIDHPSIETEKHHRSFLVTNGELEEEASRAINDMNRRFEAQGQKNCKLETVVRGQILSKIIELGEVLWPIGLEDMKTFLEIFLKGGKGILPKEKLSLLFESIFPLEISRKGKKPTREKCNRMISSAAILCAIGISNFTNSKNYIAEIEAWTMYIAYVLAIAEKSNLPTRFWHDELSIAKEWIYNSLANLCEELRGREHFAEGDFSLDIDPLYRVRITWLIALMSIYGLWKQSRDCTYDDEDDFIKEFCLKQREKVLLWGEAAIPQILSFFWYYRKMDATKTPDGLLVSLIKSICKLNKSDSKNCLPNPYYEAKDILPQILGLVDERTDDYFCHNSYTLEGIVHLFVRRNWKQQMMLLWPDITRLSTTTFELKKKWNFFRWRNKNGTMRIIFPRFTQRWEDLKALAFESEGKSIPKTIKKYPILLLLFLCIFPHRVNSSVLRWLDTKLWLEVEK